MAETSMVSDDDTVPHFIYTFSSLLQRVADCNDALSVANCHRLPPPAAASAFSAVAKPEISIPCYLERIFHFARCSHSCFVVAYIYLNRFLRLHPTFCIDSLNVHRLLITAVLTAVKFMDDRYYNNAYFAKVGGISLTELNYLEVDFLFGLRFRLNVTPTVFESYRSILERESNIVSPRIPPRLNFLLGEEESSSSCKQMEIIV
ncbi:Cyclin-P4-1 [Platanthera zijinensis]|uniref:Cyclin-P4-1 n=1 Tax=Platanthera zijinensis TaxID=2320716 RepID=A0AAP0G8P6_9ASPA